MDILHLLSYRCHKQHPCNCQPPKHFIVITLFNRLNAICQSTHLFNCSIPNGHLQTIFQICCLHNSQNSSPLWSWTWPQKICLLHSYRMPFHMGFFLLLRPATRKYLFIHRRNTYMAICVTYIIWMCVVSSPAKFHFQPQSLKLVSESLYLFLFTNMAISHPANTVYSLTKYRKHQKPIYLAKIVCTISTLYIPI